MRFHESNSIEIHNISVYEGNKKPRPIKGMYDYRIGEKHKRRYQQQRKQSIRSLFKNIEKVENIQESVINLFLTTSKND